MKSVVSKALKRAKDEAMLAEKPKSGPKKKADYDDEALVKLLEESRARIRVVGVGGGGCNTIQRMTEVGILGAETFAVNTDAQDLLKVKADRKILIGKKLTRGLGSGSDPSVGEASAQESLDELADLLSDADLVFITCGMGGGTGTGCAPIVAEIAKEQGAIVIGIVTYPFALEKARLSKAEEGISRLQQVTDTVVVIDNNRLVELVPNLPIQDAFKVADEVIARTVRGITETITQPSLINLDYADVKAIMSNGGVAAIGVGASDTNNRVDEAVKGAIRFDCMESCECV